MIIKVHELIILHEPPQHKIYVSSELAPKPCKSEHFIHSLSTGVLFAAKCHNADVTEKGIGSRGTLHQTGVLDLIAPASLPAYHTKHLTADGCGQLTTRSWRASNYSFYCNL